MAGPEREYMCCVCGSSGKAAEMFGLGLWPASDTEAFQQWFAHPACIKATFDPDMLAPVREEIEAMWG